MVIEPVVHEEPQEEELACQLDSFGVASGEHEKDYLVELPADEPLFGFLRGPFPGLHEVRDDLAVDFFVVWVEHWRFEGGRRRDGPQGMCLCADHDSDVWEMIISGK